MESASSSKDEHQHCWHYRPEVSGDQCCGCFETQKEGAPASPDELCQCGHDRKAHSALSTVGCADCSPFSMGKHLFMAAPAEPETAGEPVTSHTYEGTGGPCVADMFGVPCDEPRAAHELVQMEPEAPHWHNWSEWGAIYHGGHLMWRICLQCSETESRAEGHSCPECTPEPEAPECEGCGHPGHGDEPCGQCPCGHPVPAPVVRPPYAVAYATGSGALHELVLPDEMTCAVVDGVLVLSHPSGVLGIQQVKPMEGA